MWHPDMSLIIHRKREPTLHDSYLIKHSFSRLTRERSMRVNLYWPPFLNTVATATFHSCYEAYCHQPI